LKTNRNIRRTGAAWTPLLAAFLLLATASCTTVMKQDGIFEARGGGLKIFTFAFPRTSYESVQDAVTREVGEDAEITNLWRASPFRPWYNFLYPIIGVEIVEIYGTY